MATKLDSTTPGANMWVRILVCIFAGLLLLVTSLGLWAKNNVFDSARFSEHVVAAVQSEPVRGAIGTIVADRLYQDRPILGRVLAQPTENLVSTLLLNERFGSILDTLAGRLDERLFHGRTNPVVIDASGFTSGIEALAATLRPEAELSLPQGDDAKIVLLESDTIPNFQRSAQVILALTPIAGLAFILLAIISWLRIASKLVYGKLAGVVLISSGVVLAALTSTVAAQLSLLAKNANQATILRSIYDEFTASLIVYQARLIWLGIFVLIVCYIIQYRANILHFARTASSSVAAATKKK